jgi:arylsulfatase A-like enzyme
MKRPNIVIFNPDHYRGEALAHAGNPCVHTPNLDRICRDDGVSFTNAFCQNPVCVPSRCSFMSGWYPHVRGHRTMFHLMHHDEPVLLRRLVEEGHFVWWGGKNDLVPADTDIRKYCDVKARGELAQMPWHSDPHWRGKPEDPSFFSFHYGRVDKETAEQGHDWMHIRAAIDQLKKLPDDRPFCLYLPLLRPHPPFAVEEPFYSMIDRSKVPPRIPTPESWEHKPSMLKGICRNSRLDLSEEEWTELRATFYAMCSLVDHQFGLVVETLKEIGRYDETAIFFFSDHGVFLGDYGIVSVNQNTFEDVITRVPLLVKPPADVPVRPGVSDALVELVDFPATVEDLLGIEPHHTHFGRSLVPVLTGESKEHRDAVFCEGGRLKEEDHCKELEYPPGHTDPENFYYPRLILQAGDGPEHTKAVMCRTRRHKYNYRLYEDDEFYCLDDDPMELNNRIGDPACALDIASMKERLLRFYVETCVAVPRTPDSRH